LWWNCHYPHRHMRPGRERGREEKLSAPYGAMPGGSESKSLDLSAFAREGAWCLRLQTKGQRKGPAVPKLQPSTLRKFVSFKVRGTKGLEPARSWVRAEKCARGGVPKNYGTFRIERGCKCAFPNWEWPLFVQAKTFDSADILPARRLAAPSQLRVNKVPALPRHTH